MGEAPVSPSNNSQIIRRKMEVHVVPGGDWRAVERGRLVVPAAQGGLDLFVDPVADRLHNFGFDDVALGVDRDFNDDVTLQVPGKFGALHGRIWIHDRICDVDFMAGDRSVNHAYQAEIQRGNCGRPLPRRQLQGPAEVPAQALAAGIAGAA